MGLLSIFQRNKQAGANSANAAKPGRGGKSAARQAPLANARNPVDTAEAVREARARARTRLMGATVLLLVGVIGFPLLFETKPRPIPVDLPIEIPARNAPGLADAGTHAGAHMTSASTGGAAPTPASTPRPESVSYDARPAVSAAASETVASAPTPAKRSTFASLAEALTSSTAGAGAGNRPASAAFVAPRPMAPKPVKPAAVAETPSAAPVPTPAPTPAPPVAAPAPATPSPAAILAGAPPAKPSDAAANGGRFVVQVGAFLEDAKVREARAKVERLGLKSYTQPVDTPAGRRIRVRVGPYATKAEADRIASKVKADGLPAAVLAL
jgi:DedD protein